MGFHAIEELSEEERSRSANLLFKSPFYRRGEKKLENSDEGYEYHKLVNMCTILLEALLQGFYILFDIHFNSKVGIVAASLFMSLLILLKMMINSGKNTFLVPRFLTFPPPPIPPLGLTSE